MKGIFSPALEKLIEITLADGKLTEQEKAVLIDAAQKEGADINKLDVYIQYLLYQRKEEELNQAEKRKVSETIGDVKRCPHCGAVYVPGTLVCEACGHVFDITVQSKAYKKFNDELQKMQKKVFDDLELPNGILTYISNYPVPNNRVDLLEFLVNLQGLANPKGPKDGWTRDGNNLDFSYYYWELFTSCINKAKVYFANDKDFQPSFEFYKEKTTQKKGLFSKLFG